MRETFTLFQKPFSINAMHYRDKRYKTREAIEWSAQIFNILSREENQIKFQNLRDCFDPNLNTFYIRLKAFYPAELLFTKSGSLSSRAHDISNWEKPLIDLFFLPKFYEKDHPYGCKNLNVDDRYIERMTSSKQRSVDGMHKLEVTIGIKKLDPK